MDNLPNRYIEQIHCFLCSWAYKSLQICSITLCF